MFYGKINYLNAMMTSGIMEKINMFNHVGTVTNSFAWRSVYPMYPSLCLRIGAEKVIRSTKQWSYYNTITQ
jgi:hypothetical protein